MSDETPRMKPVEKLYQQVEALTQALQFLKWAEEFSPIAARAGAVSIIRMLQGLKLDGGR